MHNKPHTELTREKISEKLKITMNNPIIKEKMRLNNYAKKKGNTYEKMYGIEKAKEIKRKQGLALKGENNPMFGNEHTKSSKLKMSLERLGKPNPKGSITKRRLYAEGKLKIWNKGLTKEIDERVNKNAINSSKTRKKLYAEGKLIPPNLGKSLIEEHRKNIGLGHLGNIMPKEIKTKISLKLKGKLKSEQAKANYKKMWQNPEYRENQIKAVLKGLLKRPTSFEQKISDLCFKFNLPFVYKGNGNFLINFKNPDFVNEQDRVVIEVFYSWFKIRDYGSVENYKEFCRQKYNPAGWQVIFIDEIDLNCENWEEVCLGKIKEIYNNTIRL